MSKSKTPAAEPPEAITAPAPQPAGGGSWIRQPDGSLVREPGTTAEAAEQPTQE